METKTVRFVSKEKILSMLDKGELVVKREVPNAGKLICPVNDTAQCGLFLDTMGDEILGKECKLIYSRTYGCWRTGMWAIPDWLIQMSERRSWDD